jgi:AcrR family transcriptional regulator
MVEAALAVMLRKGIAATTARNVAAEMQCSPGLIHHYFATMDDLLAEAFEAVAVRGIELTQSALAPKTRACSKLIEFFRSYSRDDRDWAFQLWLDAWADANRRPALQDSSRRLNQQWHKLLEAVISAGVQEGDFICADPSGAAWRILSIFDGLTLQAVAHGPPFDRAWVLPWSAGVAERELGLAHGSLGFD